MISLGDSDARKGLGLGFGSGREGRIEMEDSELEEGEACSYNHNNVDYDACIDPDVALSYIDEKLQDVLGHFQKEFEGGVSAENLGAKFGGYGSFLPTYQRSPVGFHPRTSPKLQSNEASRSPNNFQSEGAPHNSAVSSIISRSVRPVLHANSAETGPASKLQLKNDSIKPEMCSTATHADNFERRHEVNNKTSNLTDQKTLKLRIKVPDNLSTRQNAVMNSLGLDVSPSSSLDDSSSESEHTFWETEGGLNGSPTGILQVMTTVLVHGNLLLSPLPDDLLSLSEREVFGGENMYQDKKVRPVERIDFPAEKNPCGDYWDDNGLVNEKVLDVASLAGEVYVSNTSKFPLSNSSSAVGKVKSKCGVMEKSICDMPKGEPVEPICTQDISMKNSRAISVGKVKEDGATFPDDVLSYPRKDGHGKGKKSYESLKDDSNVIKGQKFINTEILDLPKQASQKAISNEQDGVKVPFRKEHSMEGKRKLKGSHGNFISAAEGPKESVKVGSSLISKAKNTPNVDGYMKRESEDLKVVKPYLKAEDTYKEFFGELGESDEEEIQASLFRFNSEGRQKDSEKVKKGATVVNNTSKDRTSGKKTDDSCASELYPKATRNSASHFAHMNMPDAVHATTAPANDDWVCCDKCQKWRLLPPGINPENLPEKWLCSMLNWLPGMNRCSIGEEETTKAVIEKYQVPIAESQRNLHGNSINVISSGPSAEKQHLDQNLQNVGSHFMSNGGRKKNGLKEFSGTTNMDGLAQFSDSMKRNVHASVRGGMPSDVNQSPVIGDHTFQHLSRSSELHEEDHKNKQRVNHKAMEHTFDGGDAKGSKMKAKRITDQDLHRASKKCKGESVRVAHEDQMSDHSGVPRKGVPFPSSGLAAMSVGKDRLKQKKSSSSKEKADKNDRPTVSAKGQKEKLQVSTDAGSLGLGNSEDENGSKKRKANDFRNKQNDVGPLPGTGNDLLESRMFAKEEFSENDYRKEKRSKVSNSEGKDSLVRKSNSRMDISGSQGKKNLQQRQDLRSILPQQSFDVVGTFKRDSASMQPYVAATSSSSKVSVSHKAKPSLNEAKGSPVESVSSSPMRPTNCDKVTSARRNLVEKDECHDIGCLTLGSPRRCSDGDSNGGSDRSETERKQKCSPEAQHGSHESSVLDFQEKDISCLPGGQAKASNVSSANIRKCQFASCMSDYSGQGSQYPSKSTVMDQYQWKEDDENHNSASGARPRKSGKGSFRSKDRNRGARSDSMHEMQDHGPPYEVKPREGRSKYQEKYGAKSDEVENRYIDKKESVRKLSSETNRRETEGPDSKINATGSQDPSGGEQTLLLGTTNDRNTKEPIPDKPGQLANVSAAVAPLPPSGGAQTAMLSRCSQAVPRSQKENGVDNAKVDATQGDDRPNKQIKKSGQESGIQTYNSRHPVPGGQRIKDVEAPSPQRKDPANQAASNALKEAKDLKHLADRLKNSGSNQESAALYYFQAALKFLHGASLLESCSNESTKHGEMIQSMQIYSSTAKLCEFCAHEYERLKDMAAAALAYKCMEVAFMRVIYSSHTSASRARRELQSALKMIPSGESPSSSASDVDNLNQPMTVEKAALPKGVNSPQVIVNNVFAAPTRPNLSRLLSFTQDVNFAMEAARKSRAAFAAAKSGLEGSQFVEGITSVKKALDFNFQDVEGLLRLVRLAMDAIGH